MELIDISTIIEVDNPSDAPHQAPKIEYIKHEETVEMMVKQLPGASYEDIPDSMGWAIERITMSTHTGPHMDAPWHYAQTMNNGEVARTIDEIPLEWCFCDGVKFDFSMKDPKKIIEPMDFVKQLKEMNYSLKPNDIVLVESGAGPFFGTTEYRQKGAGMGKEATLWLLNQGVKVVGTDSFTWDRPFPIVAKEFRETKDKSIIWEGHYAGKVKEYFQMEKLANLHLLPSNGFKVICFPIKIKSAGAAWVRAVAVI